MADNTFYIEIFRFYSKCLTFPYEELRLELQHIFRQLEIYNQSEIDEQLTGNTLDVINYLQGEDVSAIQAEYTRMFTHDEGTAPVVSMLFTDYGNIGQTERILDEMYENLVDVSYDESPDSVPNMLEYYSLLAETDIENEALKVFNTIIVPFCKQLNTHTTLSFYKEVAKGLNELAEFFGE